eukprot:CAMPEP_0174297338 /NCGR_PEP_ID=MMETSP0809-20121228/50714_1 /TAXON_ID=73025 ORGANISM="Eutreptiella gymnastica-like, Strain CCMP1594" /NCGR_SAMPLE_ID=MMETSP0809 /ASSEMBLY_ACC=CAM_ASM_000658 /LENGTH=359 /DNA_ID=CAMNT_0015401065 /DNA_START=200 /DNA_END=1279 /DNA_ORIENTATION=-
MTIGAATAALVPRARLASASQHYPAQVTTHKKVEGIAQAHLGSGDAGATRPRYSQFTTLSTDAGHTSWVSCILGTVALVGSALVGSRFFGVARVDDAEAIALMAATGRRSTLPNDYGDVVRTAQRSVAAMLKDGARLVEVDFPVSGLTSVFGDGEGCEEMSRSAQWIAEFLRGFSQEYKAIRLFFPDEGEAATQQGLVKGNRRVRVDHLTRPSGFSDLLLDVFKRDMGTTLKDDDDLIVIAYPSFNPNEMISVRELYDADPKKRPIVVINGELDRIRTGYYPGIFYPKLIGAMKDFLPKFDQALYLHNYKGSKGGVLYRVYPEPWQVFTRRQGQRVNKVYEQETMPTTKEVALEILPKY